MSIRKGFEIVGSEGFDLVHISIQEWMEENQEEFDKELGLWLYENKTAFSRLLTIQTKQMEQAHKVPLLLGNMVYSIASYHMSMRCTIKEAVKYILTFENDRYNKGMIPTSKREIEELHKSLIKRVDRQACQ